MNSPNPPATPGDASSNTGFYDRTSGASSDDLTRLIRQAAFGEDIGQFSWTTTDEHRRFQGLLGVHAESHVLDVACGSGEPALYLARSTGCRVVGVDIHEGGVVLANEAAAREGLGDRATFLVHDARQPFPLEDETFDAIISIAAGLRTVHGTMSVVASMARRGRRSHAGW